MVYRFSKMNESSIKRTKVRFILWFEKNIFYDRIKKQRGNVAESAEGGTLLRCYVEQSASWVRIPPFPNFKGFQTLYFLGIALIFSNANKNIIRNFYKIITKLRNRVITCKKQPDNLRG